MRKLILTTSTAVLTLALGHAGPAHAQSGGVTWLKYLIHEDDYAGSGGRHYFEGLQAYPTMVHRGQSPGVPAEIRISCPGYTAEQVVPTGQRQFIMWSSPNYALGLCTETVYDGTVNLIVHVWYDDDGTRNEYRWLEWGYEPGPNNPHVYTRPIAGSPFE